MRRKDDAAVAIRCGHGKTENVYSEGGGVIGLQCSLCGVAVAGLTEHGKKPRTRLDSLYFPGLEPPAKQKRMRKTK